MAVAFTLGASLLLVHYHTVNHATTDIYELSDYLRVEYVLSDKSADTCSGVFHVSTTRKCRAAVLQWDIMWHACSRVYVYPRVHMCKARMSIGIFGS